MDKGAAETLPSKLPAPVQSLEDLNKSRAAAPIFNKVAAAASAGTIFKSQATSSNAAGKDPAEHAAGSAESPVVIADGADGGTAVEQTASVPKRNPSRDAKKGVQIAENISKFGLSPAGTTPLLKNFRCYNVSNAHELNKYVFCSECLEHGDLRELLGQS